MFSLYILHPFPLLALLRAVLGYYVQLPHLVLNTEKSVNHAVMYSCPALYWYRQFTVIKILFQILITFDFELNSLICYNYGSGSGPQIPFLGFKYPEKVPHTT
jgi:hypothetical protein